MTKMYKTANAYVVPQASTVPVWVIESGNPETVLVRLLREFFREVDVNGMYAGNFGDVRVDTVHPFAMFLFQDVLGQQLNLNVFPSVTVSDTVENETFETLGREHEIVLVTAESVAEMEGHKAEGRLLASDAAFARLKVAAAGATLIGERGWYSASHRVDINIWGDNREVVSNLYDMVRLCINTRRGYLHTQGIDVIGTLDGRRSGDINVEFGMLLFGSNITIPCVLHSGAMRIELRSDGLIASVDTTTVDESYHTT